MDNYNIKLSKDTSLIQPIQTIVKKYKKRIHCGRCNKRRTPLDESHQICHVCYKTIIKQKLSGNKIIDDFIKHNAADWRYFVFIALFC
jgi:hypothetical protein